MNLSQQDCSAEEIATAVGAALPPAYYRSGIYILFAGDRAHSSLDVVHDSFAGREAQVRFRNFGESELY